MSVEVVSVGILGNGKFEWLLAFLLFTRRQFDNVKRIFKIVEDMSGNIANNIRQNFLLSDELARLVIVQIVNIF